MHSSSDLIKECRKYEESLLFYGSSKIILML